MKKTNKLMIFGISLITISIVYIIFNDNNDNSSINNPKPIKEKETIINSKNEKMKVNHPNNLKHRGTKISDHLNKNTYEKVGINPEEYENFNDFLKDFKNFTGVKVDPLKEGFVIKLTGDNNNPNYTYFNNNKYGYLYNSGINKDIAILDIYKAYKKENIYGGYDSDIEDKIIFSDQIEHPMTSELKKIWDVDVHNKDNNLYNYIDDLETSSISKQQEDLLSYLYDFAGNYEEANSIKKDREEQIELEIKGSVTNSKGEGIKGVNIELLNNKDYSSKTNSEGKFDFTFKYFPFTHLRFKASKEGYSDGFKSISLNDYGAPYDKRLIKLDFKMMSANKKISISDNNKDKYINSNYFVVEVDDIYRNKYFIPRNGLHYKSGRKYRGNDIDLYFYQFTRDNRETNQDLLDNDTFSPVSGYVGNTMKTFGMPYIQIIDRPSGRELYTKKSNPIILQNQVHHMNKLYNNSDGFYGKITDEDMNNLVEYSEKKGGYPINFDYLVENQLLRWPAWWVLDRGEGKWESVGHRVLNKEGLVELPFYHISEF